MKTLRLGFPLEKVKNVVGNSKKIIILKITESQKLFRVSFLKRFGKEAFGQEYV